jgi:manganese-dependent inorganic pyrophosphatase
MIIDIIRELGGTNMSLPIYIIGHRRPDTDAICSAMALAELKQKLGVNAVAARIGHLNPETQFIIDKLGVQKPLYMTTAKSTLSEIDIDPPVLIYQDDSLLTAWDLCHDNGVKTLYVVNQNGEFVGMTTLAQISMIQMQDLNLTSELLKKTPAENIGCQEQPEEDLL